MAAMMGISGKRVQQHICRVLLAFRDAAGKADGKWDEEAP
jgi:hypothetical protein